MGKRSKQILYHRIRQKGTKAHGKMPPSPVIWEGQLGAIRSYGYILTRTLTFRRLVMSSVEGDAEDPDPPALLVGVENGTITLENSLQFH